MFNRYNEYEDSHRTPEDETHSFLKRYEAQAGLSSRKHYYKREPYRLRDLDYYSSSMTASYHAEAEPMIEMNIPQHRFRELVEQERYKRYLESRADKDARVVDMLKADEQVRNNNPAVEKAYRNYLLLLEMARK